MITTFKEKLTPLDAIGKISCALRSTSGTETLVDTTSDTLDFSVAATSTTPPGSPPNDTSKSTEQPVAAAAAPAKDTSAILKALADMAKTNTAASGTSQASSSNVTNPQNNYAQNVPSSVNQNPSVLQEQAVGVPGATNPAMQFAGTSSQATSSQNPPNSSNGQPGGSQAPGLPDVQQQVALLQYLQAQGVPQDQLVSMLTMIMAKGGNLPPMPNNNYNAQQPGWQQNQGIGNEQSRDQNGYNDQYVRSPSGQYRNTRARSRSPRAWDNRRDATPPRRRDSPVYGEYDGGRDGRGNFGRGGRGRGDGYRQRSPDRFRRSPSPRRQGNALPAPGPKLIEYDYSLGSERIKGKRESHPHANSPMLMFA